MIGGRSLWGSLFDVALAKYGWTLDYLLWGISFTNLNMMTADSIMIYTGNNDNEEIINADDPANEELISKIISE